MYADMPREDKHFDRDLIKKKADRFRGLRTQTLFLQK